ncbi:MAG: hypothetical protein JXA07_12790 [Spirochaetes bacterium]|nr:hypothetical protein [Spirochaetota bacterium]
MAAIKNRRRGPDMMVKMITAFSAFSWLIIIIAFGIVQMANPSLGTYDSVRTTILRFESGIIIAKALLFLNVLLCIWGMFINMARNKRKTDRFRISLLISCLVSLGGFIFMMVAL